MIELVSVFKKEPVSLFEVLNIDFNADAILVKGRYVKLARDVS